MSDICIVGSGYVGLTTGICLAKNHKITFFDIDKKKINLLNKSILPIYEPGLLDIFNENYHNIKSVNKIVDYNSYDYIILCLPTPTVNYRVDMSVFLKAFDEIVSKIHKKVCIVVKSTVKLGTASLLYKKLLQQNKSKNIILISNPEFLREGNAVKDFYDPDRYVYGGDNINEINKYHKLYEGNTSHKKLVTNHDTAELIKYASNAFLATKISFINELSQFSDKYDVLMKDVSKGMGLDKRIGENFLESGIGYGGSCFPKDTNALFSFGKDNNIDLSILGSAIKVNNQRYKKLLETIITEEEIHSKNIGVLGLSFKENTNDIRESIGIKILKDLTKFNCRLYAYDPIVHKESLNTLSQSLIFTNNIKDIIYDLDVVIICTKWKEIGDIEDLNLKKRLTIYDGKNHFEKVKKNPYIIYKGF